jgi:hypothetical protein
LVVSLGTGSFVRRLPEETAKSWTVVHWGMNGFEIVADSVSDAVDYHAKRFPQVDYHRFQLDVPRGAEKMNNATQANLATLVNEADRLVQGRRKEIKSLVGQLSRSSV